MAKLASVLDYFTQLNMCVDTINEADDYAQATQPIVLHMIQLGENVDFGNASHYIVVINDTLNAIYHADQYRHDLAEMDHRVKRLFAQYNIEVDLLAGYFNSHWWQFTGAKNRPAIASLPAIKHFNI